MDGKRSAPIAAIVLGVVSFAAVIVQIILQAIAHLSHGTFVVDVNGEKGKTAWDWFCYGGWPAMLTHFKPGSFPDEGGCATGGSAGMRYFAVGPLQFWMNMIAGFLFIVIPVVVYSVQKLRGVKHSVDSYLPYLPLLWTFLGVITALFGIYHSVKVGVNAVQCGRHGFDTIWCQGGELAGRNLTQLWITSLVITRNVVNIVILVLGLATIIPYLNVGTNVLYDQSATMDAESRPLASVFAGRRRVPVGKHM